MDNVPFYRRRSFWVSNLLLALWSLTFVGAVSDPPNPSLPPAALALQAGSAMLRCG